MLWRFGRFCWCLCLVILYVYDALRWKSSDHPRLATSILQRVVWSASRVSEVCWELFGNFRKCHGVDRNGLDDANFFVSYAIDLTENIQSLGLSVIFQMYVKSAEIYGTSNWSEAVNFGLFGKLWVLYVYIWLISARDSRANEKSQPRSVDDHARLLVFVWVSLVLVILLWQVFTCNAPKLGDQIDVCSIFQNSFLGGGKNMIQSLKHEHSSWTQN